MHLKRYVIVTAAKVVFNIVLNFQWKRGSSNIDTGLWDYLEIVYKKLVYNILFFDLHDMVWKLEGHCSVW